MNKDKHIAGDTFDESVVIPDYPASDGWTLKYYFAPRDFAAPVQALITLTATTNDNGVDYDLQAAPSTTAAWPPGVYSWRRVVEKSGARQTLDQQGNAGDFSGEFTVLQNPATMTQGFDGRSQAQKAVEDLKAALATFQSTSGRMKRYVIGSREVEFESTSEIVRMMAFWQRELDTEEAQARLAKGLSGAKRLQARL